MNNKKIAFIFLGDYCFDGRAFNMLSSLLKNNNYIDCYFLPKKNRKTLFQSLFFKEIPISTTKKGLLKYLSWTHKIYNKIKNKKYDVVVASDLYSLLPTCLAKKNNVFYDSREIYTELHAHRNSPIKKIIIKYVERFCLKNVYKVLVTAKTDSLFLQKLYNNLSINFHTIYNYPMQINTNKGDNYLRKNFNIKSQSRILIYQGVIQKGRGIKKLINIIKNTKNFVGFIVGSGEAENYYKEYVKASFLENKIYFIGEFPYIDLLQITASADVGLALISSNSISYKYALPNKLFEYAICGVPCLSHNIPNMKKYISKYQLGLCVDNSTTNQIEGINFLLKKNKPIKFPNNLSWKSQEKKFINIIHS